MNTPNDPPGQGPEQLFDGMELVAMGARGYVVRDPARPGYTLKVPREIGAETEAAIERDVAVHDALVEIGVPTIPEYRRSSIVVHEQSGAAERPCVEMTDLSEGGRNLVVSVPDVLRVGNQMDPARWFAFGQGRPAYNADQFLAQLEGIVRTMASAHGTIAGQEVDTARIVASSGLMLVAHQDGTLETIVGDYEDGVDLRPNQADAANNPTNWRFYIPIESYLTVVIRFFPQLAEGAGKLLASLSGGAYPPELLGEVNAFRRSAIFARHH